MLRAFVKLVAADHQEAPLGALEARDEGFQRFGREWYLQITPTYVYTVDGHRLSRFQGDLLAGIKRFDRNAAVVGQVVMWGEYLTPTAGLFDSKYPFLALGKPEKFQVNRTINDDAWASQDSTEQKSSEES